jgi:hypothetical protein
MGLFDFFKSKPINTPPTDLPTAPSGLEWQLVDNMFYVLTPTFFKQVKSDRFRMFTADGHSQMSITNYKFSDSSANPSKADLENMILPHYKDYVEKGGYIAIDDLEATDEYICQSFKVDEETHYYLTTYVKLGGQLLFSNFIVRMMTDYDKEFWKIVHLMRTSIRPK